MGGQWYEGDLSFDEDGNPVFTNPRSLYEQARENIFGWTLHDVSFHDGPRLHYPNAIEVSCTERPPRKALSDGTTPPAT